MKYKDNILRAVEDYQYRKAICYPKTTERIYCNLKGFYIFSFIYQIIFSVLVMLGLIFVQTEAPRVLLQNTIISQVLFVAAFILMFFKLNLVSLILNILGGVFKILPLIPLLILNAGVVDIEPAFYWQHALPLLLILICSIWMCIISTREKLLIKRDYKVVLGKIYDTHYVEGMTDEEWEGFLDSYVPKNQEN